MELFKLKKISDKIYNNILSSPSRSGSVSINIKRNRLSVVGEFDVIDFIYQSNILTDEDRELIDFIVEDDTPSGIQVT